MDIKGTFKVIKNSPLSGNKVYSLQFLNDRILFIKIGNDDRITHGMSTGQYFLYIAIYLISFFLALFITSLFKSRINSAVAVIISLLFSFISLAIYVSIIRNKRPNRLVISKESLKDISIGEILKMNKDNKEILYQDISKIEMNKSKRSYLYGNREGEIILTLGNIKEKFDIAPKQEYEQCRIIISSFLADKLVEDIHYKNH